MGASFPLQSLSLFDRICFARASISVRICRSFRESFGLSHGLVGSLSLFVMLSSVTFPGQSGCLGRLLSDSLSTALCRHHLTGVPSLVVCLDSGCGNYEQMWLTTSLRGMLLGELRVKVLTEGVHSGRCWGWLWVLVCFALRCGAPAGASWSIRRCCCELSVFCFCLVKRDLAFRPTLLLWGCL